MGHRKSDRVELPTKPLYWPKTLPRRDLPTAQTIGSRVISARAAACLDIGGFAHQKALSRVAHILYICKGLGFIRPGGSWPPDRPAPTRPERRQPADPPASATGVP